MKTTGHGTVCVMALGGEKQFKGEITIFDYVRLLRYCALDDRLAVAEGASSTGLTKRP